MVWTKDNNPHVANGYGILQLSPGLAWGLLRNGLIAGLVVGAAVGWWHRNDFSPNQELYDHWQEARQRSAEQTEKMCHDFPNSAICQPQKAGNK